MWPIDRGDPVAGREERGSVVSLTAAAPPRALLRPMPIGGEPFILLWFLSVGAFHAEFPQNFRQSSYPVPPARGANRLDVRLGIVFQQLQYIRF